MDFVSTRGTCGPVDFETAIAIGGAPDGGLYLPAAIPVLDKKGPIHRSLPRFASDFIVRILRDNARASLYAKIGRAALDLPVPIVQPYGPASHLRALELFHGPTGAFKDFGARFLLGCLARIQDRDTPLTVLTATSGDTGGAVGAAAEVQGGIRTIILYPKGRVSTFQEAQLRCWRAPVMGVEVDGDFDDCQRLVRNAFLDVVRARTFGLTSANSINIGRLLPQATYLAWAARSVELESGSAPGFIIPTGNLGHAFAALLARAMGAPIGPVIAATNANRTLSDWFRTGRFAPRPSRKTLATAMDVGAPSNFERLLVIKDNSQLQSVARITDSAIIARVKTDHREFGYLWCPHSATAAEAYARLDPAQRGERPWIAAATAHPFKFADTLEPLIDETIGPSAPLAEISGRVASPAKRMAPTMNALWDLIAG